MFITFEGIEGSGKTTQAKFLCEELKKKGIACLYTREPGGTQIGVEIRRILLSSQNKHLSPLAELLLYEADRAQHFLEVIIPNLKKGIWVICDRCFDATTVYQGLARGLDLSLVERLNKSATMGIEPDITFLIDCPPEIGLQRAQKRIGNGQETGLTRFEEEAIHFHRKVREGYLKLAKDNSRFHIIDGTKDQTLVFQEILKELKRRLKVLGI